jgi:hypothetical protein
MFAVVEGYESLTDDEDASSNCITHVETKQAASQAAYEASQIDFDFATESYGYHIIEFNGECPNCGRNFEF